MDGPATSIETALGNDPAVWGSPAFIERDQFVYFVTLAHELADPSDWPCFRGELVAALAAAWGLDTIWSELPAEAQQQQTAARLERAFELADEVRARHDPASDWEGFLAALWDARGPLRAR